MVKERQQLPMDYARPIVLLRDAELGHIILKTKMSEQKLLGHFFVFLLYNTSYETMVISDILNVLVEHNNHSYDRNDPPHKYRS